MGEPGRTLTAVDGLSVGHARDAEARTGCTAVVGPFRAAAEVRGHATGSREMDVLHGDHVVSRVDALLLTGGSAFGLAAAQGVVEWLEERGRGFETPAARVPIVPAAVLYDLGVGDGSVRPGPAMGRRAADAAGEGPVPEGAVGAGTGATVGNLRGDAGAGAGGVGSWALRQREHAVGALAVVNAFGDVVGGDGRVLSGARGEDGEHLDTLRTLAAGARPGGASPAGRNTTLLVVATDRAVSRSGLRLLAKQAMNGLTRRIAPAGTQVDGDIAFALSTGGLGGDDGVAADGVAGEGTSELMGLGAAVQVAAERAVERAVPAGRGESP
ncbi:MAG: P1 family peptidase [Candidatus Palauibacterales bacterium]|nr:P1 family peptidase [Candidatus Palauibacterales bacterium]